MHLRPIQSLHARWRRSSLGLWSTSNPGRGAELPIRRHQGLHGTMCRTNRAEGAAFVPFDQHTAPAISRGRCIPTEKAGEPGGAAVAAIDRFENWRDKVALESFIERPSKHWEVFNSVLGVLTFNGNLAH